MADVTALISAWLLPDLAAIVADYTAGPNGLYQADLVGIRSVLRGIKRARCHCWHDISASPCDLLTRLRPFAPELFADILPHFNRSAVVAEALARLINRLNQSGDDDEAYAALHDLYLHFEAHGRTTCA